MVGRQFWEFVCGNGDEDALFDGYIGDAVV